jgi:hypothetical protein
MTTVSVASLADFIQELRDYAVRIKLPVRWHVLRQPEQKECVSFEVGAWATAMVGLETDPDAYLVECFMPCGRDAKAVGNGKEGSDNADKARAKLAEACDDTGCLQLRPGKLEVY